MLVCTFHKAFSIAEFYTVRLKFISAEKLDSNWQRPAANRMRHRHSGNYYARIQVSGKLIWKLLRPLPSVSPSSISKFFPVMMMFG